MAIDRALQKKLASTLGEIAPKLKVCGHPVRLQILCAIERNESCVTELWQCLEDSQPVVSQHLAVLKKNGIVRARAEGNRRLYSIVDAFIRRLVRELVAECETQRGANP